MNYPLKHYYTCYPERNIPDNLWAITSMLAGH